MFNPQLIAKLPIAASAMTLGLTCLLSAGEPGKMTREIWNGIPGTAITDFTSSPRYLQPADSVTTFTGASAPQDIGDNFASRVRGYITAPVSGDYTFWVASDDGCELRISPTDSKCGRTKIASISGWVPPFQWDNMATQKSAPIRLIAGKKYFIEALYKEAYGGDHLAIAWQIPGGSRELIPASALESYTTDANDLDDDDLPDTWELAHGFRIEATNITPRDQLSSADPDHDGYTNSEESIYGTDPYTCGGMPGTLLLESWYSLLGAKVEALTLSQKFAGPAESSEFIFAAETPAYRGDNYGVRMSGYVIAPTTGNYTFHVAGDDSCQLLLSPSASEFDKQKIASLDGWANIRDWYVSDTQTSAPVALVAGQKYYIEALMKEAYGGDHLEIGWKTPGSSAIVVIPSSALESYVFDVQDPDGDHMPSTWESAHGLNPAVNDAALDPDGDAIPNSLEYTNGSDPSVKNSISGALLQELWWNVPGNHTASLDTEPRLLQPPDERSLAYSAQGTEGRPDHYANLLRGYLTAPVTGNYTFWGTGDDEMDFFLSTSDSKYDKQLLIHPTTPDRNFDADPSTKSRLVHLVAGQRYYLEIRHIDGYWTDCCEVAWQIPGGQREIISGSVLSTYIPTADDQDDDGLPDAWEIANGLSPTDNGHLNPKNGAQGDLDGDGLTNAAERKAGTRADLTDTDGDGVNDRDEVEILETSALMADAAPFQSVAILPGSSYTASSGSWLQENGKAKQDCVRGWLEYPVTLAKADVYQLDLTFTPVTDTGVNRDYEIVFSADGKTIQRQIVTVAEATSGHAKILSPWLTAGSHILRVFVDNSYHFRRVTVDQLAVLAARGSDANSNGTPDWVDLRLAKYNSFEAPNESITSPVCLEGKSRWFEMSRINGLPVQAAPDDRWYADVPLSASQPTSVTAALENGGLTATRQVTWKPTNLLTTGSLSLRLGDSLRLTAFTGATATSTETVALTVEGQTITLTADQPLVHAFTTAGSIPIQITHSLNGNLTTATATITVVAAPVIESPVCVVDYYREVTIPALPTGVTLQLDNRIDIQSSSARPEGSILHTLRLNTLNDLPTLLRLGLNGPVLTNLPFRAMRVRTGGSYSGKTVGLNVWEVFTSGAVSGMILKYDILIGGVTFEDGLTQKILTSADEINETGEFTLTFYKASQYGSNCFRSSVWQGSKKIAYYQ
jgi:PA14 domain/Bacterial TSP3 repeat